MQSYRMYRIYVIIPRIWEGGGQEFFFRFGICVSRSDMLRMVPMRIARGVRGHVPQRKFLKRGNLVRFRVNFDQILSLFFFQKLPFFI